MIEPGTLKSVKMAYGFDRQDVIQFFLSRGWEVSSEVKGNYSMGEHFHFITFRAGYGARPIEKSCEEEHGFDFPNAHLI